MKQILYVTEVLLLPHGFFQAPNAPKPLFGLGCTSDPNWDLTTLPK